MTTKELGELGEKLACEYLVGKGFNIVGRNYRITFGEIDIIAKKPRKIFRKKDNTVHFVEVKAIMSNGRAIFPEEHVDWRKQRKLRKMAEIWLQKQKYSQDIPYQIDVVGILVNEETRKATLHYFPNAVGDN